MPASDMTNWRAVTVPERFLKCFKTKKPVHHFTAKYIYCALRALAPSGRMGGKLEWIKELVGCKSPVNFLMSLRSYGLAEVTINRGIFDLVFSQDVHAALVPALPPFTAGLGALTADIPTTIIQAPVSQPDILTPLEVLAVRTYYEAAMATFVSSNPEHQAFFQQVVDRAERLFNSKESHV